MDKIELTIKIKVKTTGGDRLRNLLKAKKMQHEAKKRKLYTNLIDKEDKPDMAIFKTINNDYIIELERKEVSVWNEDNNYKYLCTFIFKNSIGIPILQLTTSEEYIKNLLDVVYNYIEFNMNDIFTEFNGSNLNTNYFSFRFQKDIDNFNNNTLTVYQSNLYDHNQLIPRIKIEFDSESLADFLNLIYFIFLIDIDDSLYQSPDWLL